MIGTRFTINSAMTLICASNYQLSLFCLQADYILE